MDEMTYTVFITMVSILSASGSLMIIFCYLVEVEQKNVAQKLIFFLSLGDVIFSLNNLLYTYPGESPNQLRCNVQASIKQFSCLSTVCSSFFLAYGIYESVMNKREIDDNFLYKIRLLCFVVPLTSALIPLFTRVYGSEIYSCYFLIPSGETQNIKVYVQSFLFFYGPLWLANIANIYFTVTVFKYFQKIEHFNELDQHEVVSKEAISEQLQIEVSQKIISLVMFYPLIVFICWTPYTIYKTFRLMGQSIEALEAFRFIIASMQGLLNALIFWRQKIVMKRYKNRSESLMNCIDPRKLSQVRNSDSDEFDRSRSDEPDRL